MNDRNNRIDMDKRENSYFINNNRSIRREGRNPGLLKRGKNFFKNTRIKDANL